MFKSILFLLSLWPKRLDFILTLFLQWISFFVFKKEILRVQSRLQQAKKLEPALNQNLFWKNIFQEMVLCGFSNLRLLFGKKQALSVIGQEHVDEAFQKNTSIIFISIHSGPFEHLPIFLSEISNKKVHVPGARRSFLFLEKLQKSLRTRNLIHPTTPRELLRTVPIILKNLEHIALLIDQAPRAKGKSITLLGRPFQIYCELPELAFNNGAQVIPFSCKRNSDSSHQIKFYSPISNTEPFLSQIEKVMNQMILENPTQWIWHYHRHWSTKELD